MRLNLDSEIGLARFGVETKHETKPNLPNSADKRIFLPQTESNNFADA